MMWFVAFMMHHGQSSYSCFRSYKAQSAGPKRIKVDPGNATQRCSVCGSNDKKDQSVEYMSALITGSHVIETKCSRNMVQPVVPTESKPLYHVQ